MIMRIILLKKEKPKIKISKIMEKNDGNDQIQEYNNSLTTNKILPFINENQKIKKNSILQKENKKKVNS